MIRWSNESPNVVTLRTLTLPLCTHGASRIAPNTRMAASPGGRIGVPVSTPKTPTLVMLNVPPVRSAGVVLPAFAVCTSAVIASASSRSESCSAFLILGTTSPRSVAAAIPRCT